VLNIGESRTETLLVEKSVMIRYPLIVFKCGKLITVRSHLQMTGFPNSSPLTGRLVDGLLTCMVFIQRSCVRPCPLIVRVSGTSGVDVAQARRLRIPSQRKLEPG